MQDKKRNIYQIARADKGITQEKAAELLCVSVESLRAYETGRTVPPNDIVCAMIEVYGTQYLAYQHLVFSSEVARHCLPKIEFKDLPEAVLNVLKEVSDFVKCRDGLIDIAADGKISEEERPEFDRIMSEFEDVVSSFYSLKFAPDRSAE